MKAETNVYLTFIGTIIAALSSKEVIKYFITIRKSNTKVANEDKKYYRESVNEQIKFLREEIALVRKELDIEKKELRNAKAKIARLYEEKEDLYKEREKLKQEIEKLKK